jgi:predicted glycosyltransferase
MKTLLFYCQHILGIGHWVRSMAIAQGLTADFKVYFVNGGEVIREFPIPAGIEVFNLPAIKTDEDFRELQCPAGFNSVEEVLLYRRDRLLEICDRIIPDVVMVELFPFGRRRFSAELTPLLMRAKDRGAKIACSLRDIVVTKQDQARHEAKVCKLMNRHFDQLLIHGDPKFIPLERSFSRVADLNCEVHYTGYVVPEVDRQFDLAAVARQPTIVASIGGGRFGHELLDCVARASDILADKIPHHFHLFAGPFAPDEIYQQLSAQRRPNLIVERYTPDLLSYLAKADLSISMAGYNTTLNVLQTGVRAMLLPFTGNDDQEQRLRSARLAELGIVSVIQPDDLSAERVASQIVTALRRSPKRHLLNLRGVENTASLVKKLVNEAAIAA